MRAITDLASRLPLGKPFDHYDPETYCYDGKDDDATLVDEKKTLETPLTSYIWYSVLPQSDVYFPCTLRSLREIWSLSGMPILTRMPFAVLQLSFVKANPASVIHLTSIGPS